MASLASHRRIVLGLIDAVTPWVTASRARSAVDQRANGTSLSAGGVQASALTWATWTGVNTGGRPDRGRSFSPSSPWRA